MQSVVVLLKSAAPLNFTLGLKSAMVYIRRFQIGDEPALFRIYCTAIHEIARRDYIQEQIDAWAPHDLDQELWNNKMRSIQPFVAEEGAEVVGYADIQSSGYIDHTFVSGFRTRASP